jgi:methenyltetrahydromethanopterin cyclohydrolase
VPTASGINVQFNQVVDASVINLYDIEAGTFGPADVTVVGTSSEVVKGSLVVNNDTISFIPDGGLLSPDA